MNKREQLTWLENYIKLWDSAETFNFEINGKCIQQDLSTMLEKFCNDNNLPHRSADELQWDIMEGNV